MEGAAKTLNDIREPIDKQKKEKKDHDIKCNKLRDLLDNIDTSRKQMLDKDNQQDAKVKDLEQSAKEKRHQTKDKEKLLDRNKVSVRQAAGRLKVMDSIKNKRFNALRYSGAHTINDAYQWVQAHRHEFKEVYGHVLCEVNISNAQHAAYLETQIPYYMWKAFITQDSAKRDYLVKNLKSFDVAVINDLANAHHT
nr:structural maintenance of chromosomes protein 5 [Tanacetum cinerariifolium]